MDSKESFPRTGDLETDDCTVLKSYCKQVKCNILIFTMLMHPDAHTHYFPSVQVHYFRNII